MTKKIIIIGGGPAGYEAALEGAKKGLDVTLIEGHKIGGTCLNYGCIPTKTLVEDAKLYRHIKDASHRGFKTSSVEVDYDHLFARKSAVVTGLQKGILQKFKKAKVRYIEGYGTIMTPSDDDDHSFEGNREVNETGTSKSKSISVMVDLLGGGSEIVIGDYVVIATGSKPLIPSFVEEDNKHLITSRELLNMSKFPNEMTIIGGGVIGMEFAFILSGFGVDVKVLEYGPNLLPNVDTAIGKRLKSIASKAGITVMTGAKVLGVQKDNIEYETKKGVQKMNSPLILMAIGRVGSYDKEMCDTIGIEQIKGFIKVDEHYETSLSHVYAIGDVNGCSLLAHSAYDQARQLIDFITQGISPSHKSIPSCIFTEPEIACVGVTEDEAKSKGLNYRSEKTLYGSSGKAMAMDASTGFIKTVIDDHNKLIGLHILGAHASDLIHYGSIAIEQGMAIDALKKIIFAHPTLGELLIDNLNQYK